MLFRNRRNRRFVVVLTNGRSDRSLAVDLIAHDYDDALEQAKRLNPWRYVVQSIHEIKR